MKRYKFLKKGLKSANGDCKWKIGEWKKHGGELEMCESGFHCSKGIYQAFSYIQGEILAEVEVKGKNQKQDDKEVWSEMRITRAWKWTKKDSVMFAVFAARLVLDIFEKKYPEDKRPRQAIEAAEAWVKNPTKKNRDAAWDAAWAAGDAEAAAWAAARTAARTAAWAAARTAWAAARTAGDAARTAGDAARTAGDAAWDAAWAAGDAVYKKCDKWMLEHIKELEEI